MAVIEFHKIEDYVPEFRMRKFSILKTPKFSKNKQTSNTILRLVNNDEPNFPQTHTEVT